MEFVCVLSVEGSLASYVVRQEPENRFKAVLKSYNGKQENIPPEFVLEKTGDGWEAIPWHDQIVTSLAHAIEANR
jgi:hypothetical protein